MTTRRQFVAAALASTAAAMFAIAPSGTAQAGSDAKVHCFGVNECKGHNDCKTDHNACKGHGACKGQGFVAMSREDCEKAGGSVDKPKDA